MCIMSTLVIGCNAKPQPGIQSTTPKEKERVSQAGIIENPTTLSDTRENTDTLSDIEEKSVSTLTQSKQEGNKSEKENKKSVKTPPEETLEYTSRQQRAIYDALAEGTAERINDYTEITFHKSVGLEVKNETDAVNTLKAMKDIFNIENFDYVATEINGPEGERGYYLQQLYDGVPIEGSFFRMYLREDNTLSTVFSGVQKGANKGVPIKPVISKERAIEIANLKNITEVSYSNSTEYEENYWMIRNLEHDFVAVGSDTGKILFKGNDAMQTVEP